MYHSMQENKTNADDQQLSENIKQLNGQLITLTDCDKDNDEGNSPLGEASSSRMVLAELQRNFSEINLDGKAPEFEFHGYGCEDHADFVNAVSKRPRKMVAAKYKSRSGGDLPSGPLVSHRKQEQLQKENLWNQYSDDESITLAKLRSIGLHGDCLEHNPVLRLMGLFRSLHELLNAELPSAQLNALPSDYVFDWPKKSSLPNSMNVRHQVQVLSTKVERFLAAKRRQLEANKHFDFVKYNECDMLLQGAKGYLQCFMQLASVEVRHRGGQFVNQATMANAKQLESLLLGLREWICAAHLNVHVFNWEMDYEHRFSKAMTEQHEATMQLALQQVDADKKAALQPKQRSHEEQILAHDYQLDNVLQCASEHEDFLTALMLQPQAYFPAEVVAICSPIQPVHAEQPTAAAASDNAANGEHMFQDIIEMPSSPPKVSCRPHQPLVFKG